MTPSISDHGPRDPADSLLSAFLDDELTADERTYVESALLTDADLRAELDSIAATRNLVRDLPLLEVPDELAARLLRSSPLGPLAPRTRRSRTRAVALSALASIAFWAVFATSSGTTAIAPDLASVVGAHLTASGGSVHAGADPSVVFTAPGALDSYELVYVSRRGQVAHLMYTDGTSEISVFEQPGRIDWNRVPASGSRREVAGSNAWTGRVDGQVVMLIERRDMVYILVSSTDAELEGASAMMPGTDKSLLDRLRSASRRTIELFGLAT